MTIRTTFIILVIMVLLFITNIALASGFNTADAPWWYGWVGGLLTFFGLPFVTLGLIAGIGGLIYNYFHPIQDHNNDKYRF